MEPFLGQLALFGFNFAPRGWAFCEGQLLSIAQNAALFSLLGTTYGGDGITTFALPDLRGRIPFHFGQGPGLPDYKQGEASGATSVVVLTSNLPAHTHPLQAASAQGSTVSPAGAVLATFGVPPPPGSSKDFPYAPSPPDTAMSAQAIGPTGGSQPVATQSPYLTLNWCIATAGVFPSRS